jgi:ATP-dependent helicase/nuclease subunit B
VVLPGLDMDLDPAVWATLGDEEQHPQNALWRLLDHGGFNARLCARGSSPQTPAAEARGLARQRLINEALRPPARPATGARNPPHPRPRPSGEQSADPIALGLENLGVMTARAEEDAAATLALMMRETLEVPGKTCALVTPDLDLGRRVAARLERWGIVPDSSSGASLCRACPPAF